MGAGLTLWVTFLPCFAWIFLGAPYVERLHAHAKLAGALAGVTAAVVGVIANLALWFGLRVLFGEMAGRWPVLSSLQWDAALLALVAAFCLFGLRLGVAATLGIAALAGLALRMIF
jgi:chromate transporter